MASDQRFQRTVLAVAEAVQTFAAGTFDFAESIKQIWGPQAEPDAVETSNPLPVDTMQGVQVDHLRERTPISQEGDQLKIHSHSQSPSTTSEDENLKALNSAIGPLQAANLQLLNEIHAPTQRSVKCCYECFTRWIDESQNPPCQSIPGQEACKFCTQSQNACEMIPQGELPGMLQRKRDADAWLADYDDPRDRRRFLNSWYWPFERQQASLKRVYRDIDEQQPVPKRQRKHEVREGPIMERNEQLKKIMQQEQDDHGAVEARDTSPLVVSSSSSVSSSEEEEKESQVQVKRQKMSPFKDSDQAQVAHKVTHEEVLHLEEENERSSTLTQGHSSEVSSSEEDDDGYSSSSSEEEGVQILATKESSQGSQNVRVKVAIQAQDESSDSSSSSEDEPSEEESEDDSQAQQKNTLALKSVWQDGRNQRMKVSIPTLLEEESDDSESSSSSSEDNSPSSSSEEESSEDESETERKELKRQPVTREELPEENKFYPKELVQSTDGESSSSPSENESSEESKSEPELPKNQLTTLVESQKGREANPNEPIEITSDESSSSSSDEGSSKDSEMET
ncbi:uncharacterized protein N7500_008665 [Penicillium coprophilum]|uniref:uncharacterized protein n=1 Tax=Penicillium coprophilum TaxID=36646 RepID=UPI0023A51446|nr:uncharacterized protein N7500_008665 [Penicillium coprophilum]KAJ5159014.1 hypothetical protein N7500_008665 [Penicillium coprophilum]